MSFAFNLVIAAHLNIFIYLLLLLGLCLPLRLRHRLVLVTRKSQPVECALLLIISSFSASLHFIKCLISLCAPNCHFTVIVSTFFKSFCVTVASSASTNLSSCCSFWTIRLGGDDAFNAAVIEIKCFNSNIILIIHKENKGKTFVVPF